MRFGILQKIAFTLGVCFALPSVVGSVILYGMLQQFHSGLSDILDVARPLDMASYEMEINALEIGLEVEGFLHHPEPSRREDIAAALMDFHNHHTVYKNTATSETQIAMGAEIDRIFSGYAKLGLGLIDLKTAYIIRRDAFINALNDLEDRTKLIAKSEDPEISGTTENRIRQLTLFSILWAETSEALSLLDKMETDPGKTGKLFAEEIDKIDFLLNDYLQNWPPESKPAWLDQMVKDFSETSVLAKRMVATSEKIDNDLYAFVQQGKQLNDFLDDKVQLNSEASLQTLYGNLTSLILVAYSILVGWMPVLVLMFVGMLLFIARNVVQPVQQLSRAADIISEGNFSHRVNDTQKDELGHLGSTFNTMAGRLKAAYENLSRTNAELDAKVEQRTQALASANDQLNGELVHRKQTEIDLRKAITAANAASNAKTLFLGNMSHELRTPLNAIIGFSDVIRGELFGPVTNDKYLDYANDINQSGMHLLRLINELLDISRIEAGELSLSEQVIDLADCISESLHMLKEQAVTRGINLIHAIADDLPFMRGDQTRIKQVLINLAGNAIKFTPPEGSVTVSAMKLPDGSVQLRITDTGIGISAADMQKVLEPFGQVANALTRAHEGAGLGLPLAKLLVERHEGVLLLDSAPGHGTTATVTFPAHRSVAAIPAQKSAQPVVYRNS